MAIFRRRRQILLYSLGLLLVITVYLILNQQWGSDQGAPNRRYKPIFLPPETLTDIPIVLWWTPFTPFSRAERACQLGKCLVTHSRTEVDNPNTGAIVFEGTMMDWRDLPLPRRLRGPLWALLLDESPRNNWPLIFEEGIGLFNVTSTWSRYSDFSLVSRHLDTIERLVSPVSVPTSLKSRGDVGLVMYLYSNCDPPSDRDTYVRELMKYVKVDSYGRCLHNKDLPNHLLNTLTFSSEEIYKLHAKYKFSISFENAICEDYITEKFWRPLVAGSVPIVRGSPTILDWAPDVEHSVIVADHFSSPKDLADFLLYLDQNDEEYERYLEFKRSGITNKRLLDHMTNRGWFVSLVFDANNPPKSPDFITGFECFVCNTLHKRSLQSKEGHPPLPIVANHQHYSCPIPTPSLMKKEEDIQEVMSKLPGETKGSLRFWRYTAQCSEQKAKVLSETIGRGATQEELNSANEKACRDMYF